MTFTYVGDLSTNLDKIRFYAGDTQSNAGPRPDKRNFTDEEIAALLTIESSEVNATIASLFETLASEWTSYALSESADKVSYNARNVAENYFNLSQEWRSKPGGASETERAGSVATLERGDAYT